MFQKLISRILKYNYGNQLLEVKKITINFILGTQIFCVPKTNFRKANKLQKKKGSRTRYFGEKLKKEGVWAVV